MSGVAPHILVAYPDHLLALGDDLLYLYDGNNFTLIVNEGVDLFTQGCFIARTNAPEAGGRHPEGSFNVSYPYCRTAIRYRMDDPRSNPQIAQIVAVAPIVEIKLLLDGCDPRGVRSATSFIQPTQPLKCGAELYPGYSPTELYFVVDSTRLTLPSRLNFAITNTGGVKKSFWIGMRSSRGGPASGSVV